MPRSAGVLILRNAAVEVIEGVCEAEVRRQLGLWVLEQHPGEPRRHAQALPEQQRVARLAEVYGVDRSHIEAFLAKHLISHLKEPRTALISAAVTGKIDVRSEVC